MHADLHCGNAEVLLFTSAVMALGRFTHDRRHEFEVSEIYLDDGELGLILRELGGQKIDYSKSWQTGARLEVRCDFCGRWSVGAKPTSLYPWPRWRCTDCASTGYVGPSPSAE